MNAILMAIVSMSLTASVVAVVVLLARLLMKRVPKVFSYALWALVLFRMVCPFSFSSDIGIVPNFHEIMTQAVVQPAGESQKAADVYAESPQIQAQPTAAVTQASPQFQDTAPMAAIEQNNQPAAIPQMTGNVSANDTFPPAATDSAATTSYRQSQVDIGSAFLSA